MQVRVWPGATFQVSTQTVSDNKWHNFKLRVQNGQPIRTYIDGKAGATSTEVDKSNFDWADEI
jgi:hypothetical protein